LGAAPRQSPHPGPNGAKTRRSDPLEMGVGAVTRPKPIGHAIRCAKCGQKFTRTHARQRNCPACQPNRVKARSAARAARRSATVPAATPPPLGRQLCLDLAAELARKTDGPGPLGTPPRQPPQPSPNGAKTRRSEAPAERQVAAS
jgi:DNA-directed RNA polymerase subunit RPC12/RpoP